ncbi:DUF2630 domain-containing protein [Streptomyces sp. Act143]|uniref:DUF2630 family protein n=1 Tax=Streptomyces sp. Act143 TaxID=2200760 RepID=UPI000D67D1C3|nr:DUF2630 family protein [Streptomyces sp. Act143]PWI19413.1 DUF2630 domain-containing protein [Streptomyces sp. Act143]
MSGPDAGTEKEILGRITQMISEERHLRDSLAQHTIDQTAEHSRLARLETELDQCWDLLRQRRALAAAGQDASTAQVRPASQVERYLS